MTDSDRSRSSVDDSIEHGHLCTGLIFDGSAPPARVDVEPTSADVSGQASGSEKLGRPDTFQMGWDTIERDESQDARNARVCPSPPKLRPVGPSDRSNVSEPPTSPDGDPATFTRDTDSSYLDDSEAARSTLPILDVPDQESGEIAKLEDKAMDATSAISETDDLPSTATTSPSEEAAGVPPTLPRTLLSGIIICGGQADKHEGRLPCLYLPSCHDQQSKEGLSARPWRSRPSRQRA